MAFSRPHLVGMPTPVRSSSSIPARPRVSARPARALKKLPPGRMDLGSPALEPRWRDVLGAARWRRPWRRRSQRGLQLSGGDVSRRACSVRHRWIGRRSPPRPHGEPDVVGVFGDERAGLRWDELSGWRTLTRVPVRCAAALAEPPPGRLHRRDALARGPERQSRGAPRPENRGPPPARNRARGCPPGRSFRASGPAGATALVAFWRRSGLTRAGILVWESAIRTLARSLSHPRHPGDLGAHQNT